MVSLTSKLGSIALSGLLFMNAAGSGGSGVSVYKQVSPAIVSVSSKTMRRDPFSPRKVIEVVNGSGTGFFVDKKRIVTNYHVVKDADKVSVRVIGGKEYDVVLDKTDVKHDIALMHLEDESSSGIIKFCEKEPVVGQEVFAIGDPYGFERSFTSGIVSGLDRTLEGGGGGGSGNLLHMIQVDAAINPGNSGGALVDAKDGCVLGMNTAIISAASGGGSDGLGFATPAKYIADFVDTGDGNVKVDNGFDNGFVLGVQLLNDQIAAELGIEGVVVVDVIDGMPASDAGIMGTKRSKDGYPIFGDIIVGISRDGDGDGGWMKVSQSIDLYKALDKYKIGDVIKLRVLRNDGLVDIYVSVL